MCGDDDDDDCDDDDCDDVCVYVFVNVRRL